MGRISLTALRVRRRALANLDTKAPTFRPVWVDVMHDVPPAQIFTRQQPIQHARTTVRTKSLPHGGTAQRVQVKKAREPKNNKLQQRIYSPKSLSYEEDALRKQFFSDHPWELARPRIVLETTGQQYAQADWSTGLIQPGIPLSGECVVQRQLWLLENVPDITNAESYDIARKEFYALRRREATARRIAVEEAQNLGAHFGPNDFAKAMAIESKAYNDWEQWAEQANMEADARNASFSGQQVSAERKALEETRQVEAGPGSGSSNMDNPLGGGRQPYAPGRPLSSSSPRVGVAVGNDVFAREARKRETMGIR
jgi:small subunit ribosomal protein S23